MLDDELTVVTTPIKVARSYIEMQQDVYRNDTLLCRGHLKIACVDRTMKPKGMPQNMRQTFADL